MEQAVAALAREPNSALVVPPDVFIVANRASVIELAARHRLPAVYAFRNMAVEGGLMSYGVDVADLYRRSAAYVDRILKGAQAGRAADPGTDPLRARPQPEDRQVYRPRSISRVSAAHRRGDRMRRRAFNCAFCNRIPRRLVWCSLRSERSSRASAILG